MNRPNRQPIASTSGRICQNVQPYFCASVAEIMVVSATIDPTDRSMPPEMITKVMPTATTSRNPLSINRLTNTCGDRKAS